MARTVRLEIQANVQGAVAQLRTLGRETQNTASRVDSWARQHEQSLDTVGRGLTAFGLTAVAGAGMAVKKFADFDKAMSSVQAATHESAENMELLRNAAVDAGADTAFSAEEAARGIEELAKAGVSTADVLGGGLDGALSLAAAGALSVGESAEIAASALTQFKLSGDQVPHLADLLAAGAGKAQGSVHDLGAALNQSGLVASSTGLTIEETTGALAAFASAGLVGSDAGTSFKTMLMSLNPNSDEAAKIMKDLGISAYDASGEFIGMSEYAGVLRGALKDMSSEQRNATLKTLFGSDAVRAANVLYEQGAEGIQKWEDAVNDAGYAAETAAIMQDNLAGDIEKLGGAFDTVFIKSGSGANDALRGIVQSVEAVVDAIGQIPAPILSAGAMFAGVAGGAALLGAAAINVIPKIRDTKTALRDLGVTGRNSTRGLSGASTSLVTLDGDMTRASRGAGKLGNALKGVGTGALALAAVGPALSSMVSSGNLANLDKLNAGLLDTAQLPDILSESFTGKGNWFDGLDVGGFQDAIGVLTDPSWTESIDQSVSKFLTFGTRSSSNWEFAKKNVDELDSALAGLAKGGNADQAQQAFEILSQMASDAGIPTEKLVELFPQYSAALQLVGVESKNAADGSGELEGALGGVGGQAEQVAESLDDILDSIFELGRETRTTIEAEDALTNSLKGLTESVAENGKTFTGNSEAALKNREALLGVADDMETVIDAQARGGASAGEIQSTMKSTYDAMMKATGGSEELVRSILSIPADVKIETWMSETAKEIADGTAAAIELIPGYTKVSIAVSEDGTAGQVQGKIDSVTGKTEYIFVTDDGTSVQVQAGIANIDGKKVPVFVSDDGTVYSTEGKIQGIKGKDVTIQANAATEAAEAELNRTARDRQSRVIQTVQRNIQQSISWLGGAGGAERGGRGGITRASGGSVFGPGSETSDSIPAWLSNNEHVLSAREVRGLGGHGAVERLRALARNGDAPAFKSGGALGRAQDKVDRLQRQYSRMPGDKKNRARKLDLKDDLDAAKRELAAVKKSSKDAEKAASDARERAGRLSESRFDLRRDLRRGEITDSFTSGSGMSIVDRMFADSKSEDLSKGKRAGLRRNAYQLEGQLLRLGKQSDSLKSKLEKATEARDRLLEVSKSVSDGLRGEYSLGGVLSNLLSGEQKGPLSASSFVKSAQGKAAQIRKFGGMLTKLRKQGYSEAIIQEIADLGTVEGTQVGNALLGATKAERTALNKAYKSMDYWSGQAGDEVTKSMYRGGIDAAEGLVRGLEGKTKDVEDAFYKLGKNAEKSFKRSLGIKSPSRVMRAAGVNVGEGAELGILSKVGDIQSAAEQLMTPPALTVPPSYEVSRYAQAQTAQASAGVTPEDIREAMAGMSFELHGNSGKLIAKMVDSEVQSATRNKKSIYR